jgi:hypothetical protein
MSRAWMTYSKITQFHSAILPFRTWKIFADPKIKFAYMKLKYVPQISTDGNKQTLKKMRYK